MALRASLPERAMVAIVIGMAVDTAGRRRVELPRRVASLAGHGRMHAHQREVGKIVVEVGHLGPGRRAVAAFATLTLAAGMNVVSPMAADAIASKRVGLDRDFVAGLAGELSMPADERKIRGFRVIELHARPLRRRMTGLTFITEQPAVRVIAAMTA